MMGESLLFSNSIVFWTEQLMDLDVNDPYAMCFCQLTYLPNTLDENLQAGIVFTKVPPWRPCSKIKTSCAQKKTRKKHTYKHTENMADKVSWIFFYIKETHSRVSTCRDAGRGEKLQSHKCYNQIFVLQANAKRTQWLYNKILYYRKHQKCVGIFTRIYPFLTLCLFLDFFKKRIVSCTLDRQ